MEVVILLLLIIILLVTRNQHGHTTEKIGRLQSDIKYLKDLLKNTDQQPAAATVTPPKAVQEEIPLEEEKSVQDKYWETGFTVVNVEAPPLPNEAVEPTPPIEEIIPGIEIPEAETIIPVITAQPVAQQMPEAVIAPPVVKETRRPDPGNDMEKFIGEKLISKIGIAILVLGIGFFVKYAIDKDWIGSAGRVGVGLFCGALLIGLGHRLRNVYKGFSSVLAGGGIAAFYFTICLAFQLFGLFSQQSAFIIMSVITAFAVALSLLYDRQELAIIALIGGFAAPFMVNNGNGNYMALFTYLIILNAGLLVIAYNKSWRLLNLLSFIFTVITFGGWMLGNVFSPNGITTEVYRNAFLFATAFYLLYFLINTAYNVREGKKFIASDFGILLANSFLYFAAGIFCLEGMGIAGWQGSFSILLGLFNIGAAFFIAKKQPVDKNVFYLFVGIAISCVSIAGPLQLDGNYITLFWATETVLLYWLFSKSQISLIKFASEVVWVAMLVSLVMDWEQIYGEHAGDHLAVIFNKGFITSLFVATASYLVYLLRLKQELAVKKGVVLFRDLCRITAFLLLFAAGMLEIDHQFSGLYLDIDVQPLYMMLYIISYILALVLLSERIKQLQMGWQLQVLLLTLAILFYLFFIPSAYSIQFEMLNSGNAKVHFMAHWTGAVLLCCSGYKLLRLLQNNKAEIKAGFDTIVWILCIVGVVFISIESQLLANNIFYAVDNPVDNIEHIFMRTGLPILWGLCSFAFMWLGMKHKYRTLRIISLTLFTVTLLKLFLFDISNIPAGGKIAAFICLGILLLVISFMYQRLKKIIIDEERDK